MNIEDFQDIVYEKDEKTGIVTVTLNRPERKNAMSHITFLELWYATEIMGKDKTARAMIITGAKDAFSSGGYFNMDFLKTLDPELKKEIDITDIAQKKLCVKMWKLDKPIIAAINGLAIGAGFTMPFACADLVYMADSAYIHLPFVRIGIIPEFACTYLLPRLIGFHKTKEIVFFGEKIDAKKALELGLVNDVVPLDKLMDTAREAALKIIPPKGAFLAIRMAKRALHRPLIEEVETALDWENKGLNKTAISGDFNEALKARKEKRDPVFKGK
ncbi:MAG: enoyl-CoA hydratase/isomerase family protein [Candidatus Helarchaeota archaeon]